MRVARARVAAGPPVVVALVAALLAGLAVTPARADAGERRVPAAEVELVERLNAERADRSLPRLPVHPQLVRLAREHSARMAADSDAGGDCGDGTTLRHREPLSRDVTIRWTKLRENVGCGWGSQNGAEQVHEAFMESPGHRANILADDVEQVGVGVWHDADGGLWVTQLFVRGAPRPELAPIREGLAASRRIFEDGDTPPYVVVSRSDVFADSLGGAALAGDDAPILFTDGPTAAEPEPVLRPRTRVELDRLLGGSGTVYLLGGSAAVSPAVADELTEAGYRVRRLGGETRFDTAAAIAREVVRLHGAPDRIAVAFGRKWPDAVTGGAAAAREGTPIVLVERDTVPPATARLVGEHPDAARVVLGGKLVVSDSVRRRLDATRLAGATRAETSLAIADGLFDRLGDRVVVVDGWDPDGWGRALAWATYAARHGAPQVLVGDTVPDRVADWLDDLDGVTPHFESGVTAEVREQVESLLDA